MSEEPTKFPLIKMENQDFRNRLRKIKPFMSNQETRYYLCGVYMTYDHGAQQITMAATNGHILQEQIFEVEADLSEAYRKFETIIPASAVNDLLKIMPSGKGDVFTFQLVDGGKFARFDFFESEYTTAVIEGSFPDYKRIMPKGDVILKSGLAANYLIAALSALGNEAVDICVDNEKEGERVPHLLTSNAISGLKCVIMPKVAFGVEDVAEIKAAKKAAKEAKKKKAAA